MCWVSICKEIPPAVAIMFLKPLLNQKGVHYLLEEAGGDSEAMEMARGVTARQRWAGAAVFSARCRPHAPPRPCPTPIHVQPPYAPHAFRPPMALPYKSMALLYASTALPYASMALPYPSQPMPMHPTTHLWLHPCPTQHTLSSIPQLYPCGPDTHRHMMTHPAHATPTDPIRVLPPPHSTYLTAPMCCPPTLMRHPCRLPTLYMPLPQTSPCCCCRPLCAAVAAPLCAAMATLSVLLLPPSRCHCCHPLGVTAATLSVLPLPPSRCCHHHPLGVATTTLSIPPPSLSP